MHHFKMGQIKLEVEVHSMIMNLCLQCDMIQDQTTYHIVNRQGMTSTAAEVPRPTISPRGNHLKDLKLRSIIDICPPFPKPVALCQRVWYQNIKKLTRHSRWLQVARKSVNGVLVAKAGWEMEEGQVRSVMAMPYSVYVRRDGIWIFLTYMLN